MNKRIKDFKSFINESKTVYREQFTTLLSDLENFEMAEMLCLSQDIDFGDVLEKVFNVSWFDKYLNLEGDTIQEKAISLKELKDIGLANNNLKTIPKEIGMLKNVKSIYLDNNNIEYLPNEICDLYNLKELTISNNPLKELPTEFGNLSMLNHLWCANCELTSLPSTFNRLTNLKNLNLKQNKISNIESITKLNNLMFLYLSNNIIKNVPNNINNCINLHTLDLQFNQIKNMPDITLPILVRLYINNNQIVDFNLDNIVSLDKLSIENNPLSKQTLNMIKNEDRFDISYE